MDAESRGSSRRRGTATELLCRQLPILLAADAVYVTVRALTEGAPAVARAHARDLLAVERALHLDWEAGVQSVVLPRADLVHLFNWIYVWMYWPFLVAALLALFLTDRPGYFFLRNALILSGGIGLVFFALVPVAPPRFMPGFVGTVTEESRRHFVTKGPHWVNRYAALPSFHAGWTLIASIVLAASCTTLVWRGLALLPGIAMGTAVVATGNHFVVDVVVGDAIALGALVAVGWRLRTLDTVGGSGRSRPVAAPGYEVP